LNVSRQNRHNTLSRCIHALIWCTALAPQLPAAGPLVLLIGGPGSGKSTQAEILRKERQMTIISADDLIAGNRQVFEKVRNPALDGVDVRQDPALNRLIEEALGKADLSKGVVIDGYPAAKNQADFLAAMREKLDLPQALIIHLHVPDKVLRKRMKKSKTPDGEQRLKDYHREFDFIRTYFPESQIRDVDGNKRAKSVAKAIRKLLEQP
jgi:adenylate kinase